VFIRYELFGSGVLRLKLDEDGLLDKSARQESWYAEIGGTKDAHDGPRVSAAPLGKTAKCIRLIHPHGELCGPVGRRESELGRSW
jgi:hypothetical protein